VVEAPLHQVVSVSFAAFIPACSLPHTPCILHGCPSISPSLMAEGSRLDRTGAPPELEQAFKEGRANLLAYTRQTLTAANQVLYALPVIGSTLLLVVHRKEERGQRAGVPHLYQRQTAPMLFSVGSLHDKSRQQAWCMGPTLLFLATPATSFNQSYVLFRDTGIHDFFFSFVFNWGLSSKAGLLRCLLI